MMDALVEDFTSLKVFFVDDILLVYRPYRPVFPQPLLEYYKVDDTLSDFV
jgi:hypothetical protein